MSEPPVSPRTLEQRLEVFADAVASSPHNLLSRRGLAELRTRHIPESLALAGLLPKGRRRLLDVGSGGGLPGVVIAAARPDLEVTLLEATRKKAAFLEQVTRAMALEVEVDNRRAEEAVDLHAGFDLVTARAVAPLDRLVGWTVPFLTPSGRVFAVKGERWREEIPAARRALQRAGARIVATPDTVAGTTPGGRGASEPAPLVVIIARA